jgi:hypothetical protein
MRAISGQDSDNNQQHANSPPAAERLGRHQHCATVAAPD